MQTNIANPAGRKANHLAGEKSPYLLQHQFNPVDWHPWGEDAFSKARRGNKPIFLSIGYSTCHWCHVMERESFEDQAVADFLNQNFVSIKVDREERPDVDKIYMTAVQALTGQGGWPLSAFLTPDLKPFYGGTYFPPDGLPGRPGFLSLLRQVWQIWQTRPHDVQHSADDLHRRLAEFVAQPPPGDTLLHAGLLLEAATAFKQDYEPINGGFGHAPKFPQPSLLAFLFRYGVRNQDYQAVRMVLHTCERMAAGGIYDHLGGGFSRYSVDERWLVPHFEKMLYDNAQLLNLYLDAWLLSGQARFAEVARGIVDYVLRDMTHPDGGFYSAEDADSEGKEGKFYCWTRAEMAQLLTPEEFNVAAKHFGVTSKGNFVDHSDPNPLPNQNVLSLAGEALADEDKPLLQSAVAKLFAARSKRVRPHLDDKVLASWNGLMLGALARAGRVLHRPEYLAAAVQNSAFIRAKLWDPATRTLYHRWRDGERDTVQLHDAYAFQLYGHLGLYEATLAPEHLEFAIALADRMIELFEDREAGGFWPSGAKGELVLNIKEDYDGAEPSGNSVAAQSLLKLAAMTGKEEYQKAAERVLRLFAQRLERLPQTMPFLLMALDSWLEEPSRIVVAGDLEAKETDELITSAHGVYQPNTLVLGHRGPVDEFTRTLHPLNGRAAAYLCSGTACQAPVQTPAALRSLLLRHSVAANVSAAA